MEAIRVLIMDDHPIFRRGIRWILEAAPDMEVVGEADDGQHAVNLADRLTPDVVLININLPGINTLEFARMLKRRDPRMRVVVLSMTDDDELLFSAIKVGVAAYTTKEVAPDTLTSMIREVASGTYLINDTVMSRPHVASRVLDQFRSLVTADVEGAYLFAPLTSREIEILDCIARGMCNKEIGVQLSISSQTVKNHVTSILAKLQVNDRTMAVIYAIQRGWIKLGDEPQERSHDPQPQPASTPVAPEATPAPNEHT